jgi:hypothetical protein
MNRRAFIQNAAVAGLAGEGLARNALADDKTAGREFYELRAYYFKDDTQRKLVDGYLEKAFIPAMNRLGSAPIGVFGEAKPDAPLFVLIPYSSLENFVKAGSELLADAEHNKAGADYLAIKAPERPYDRIESSLLHAFENWPKLIVPPQTKDKHPRIFQLRTYESPSEVTGKKKIEMFQKGESEAFKNAGANPVFFAETLIGAKRPNLTYMLAFDDVAAKDKAWGQFRNEPGFKSMISLPEYSDKQIIRAITNTIVTPTAYSQV